MDKKINFFVTLIVFVLMFNLVSGVIVDSVSAPKIKPGETGAISVSVKNDLRDDIEEVSLILNLEGTRFTTLGSSEDSEDEIKDGDEERFSFVLKAPSDIAPGDYNIPYTINYKESGSSEIKSRTGTFGITISADTELDFSIETETPVIGRQGKVTLEIINEGLGDVKSVSVQIRPQGFELLSKDKIFIGSIDAEDSDIVTWDVLFKGTSASFVADLTYKDFDNTDQTKTITFPIKIYTEQEAIERGLIQKNNTLIYVLIVILVLLLWFVYRKIKKARKKRDSKKPER